MREIESLERLWPKASDDQRTALAETCTLQVVVYFTTGWVPVLPISEIEHYAEAVASLFNDAFPYAVDFTASLAKQRESEFALVKQRKNDKPWHILELERIGSMALSAAVSALGGSYPRIHPIRERFPVEDSSSLAAAGVPDLRGDPLDVLQHNTLLYRAATTALQTYSELREGGI